MLIAILRLGELVLGCVVSAKVHWVLWLVVQDLLNLLQDFRGEFGVDIECLQVVQQLVGLVISTLLNHSTSFAP